MLKVADCEIEQFSTYNYCAAIITTMQMCAHRRGDI